MGERGGRGGREGGREREGEGGRGREREGGREGGREGTYLMSAVSLERHCSGVELSSGGRDMSSDTPDSSCRRGE